MYIKNNIYPCSPYTESAGFTKLMYLIINTRSNPKYLHEIRYILDHNILEINKTNDQGWTPIMLAVRNYNTNSTPETVKLLLDYNPDLYIINKDKICVFDLCITNYYKNNFFDIFKLLLDKVNINQKNMLGDNLFMIIIKNSILLDHNLVRFFLDNYAEKIDLNIKNRYDQNAYDIAINMKLYNIAEMIGEYYFVLEKYALD